MSTYEDCRKQMKTGDVIAFSGKGRVSELIKWKTGSPYSHVAMVVAVDLSAGFGKSVMITEATTLLTLPDAKTGELVKGVQMQWLSQRLDAYDGDVWWGQVLESFPVDKLHNMTRWIRQRHVQRTPYDAIQAMGAGMDLFDWIPGVANDPDFSSLFCSEYVMRAWQIAGLVDDTVNPSEMTPADVMALPFVEAHVLK